MTTLSRQIRNGFTLVELLVVIGLVVALSSLVIVAVKKGIAMSKMATCASNLRNIGIAMQQFANDNQGFYPDTTHTKPAEEAWITQLEEYLGENSDVFICPADLRAKERRSNRASSYILNNLVFAAEIDAMSDTPQIPYNRPDRLPEPSQTILVFPVSDSRSPYRGEDHTHSEMWSSWGSVTRDIAPDIHKRQSSANSSKGSANYLYADGHVESFTANEFKQQIEQGKNLGEIPGVVAP